LLTLQWEGAPDLLSKDGTQAPSHYHGKAQDGTLLMRSCFFCSGESSFITAQEIIVDGGTLGTGGKRAKTRPFRDSPAERINIRSLIFKMHCSISVQIYIACQGDNEVSALWGKVYVVLVGIGQAITIQLLIMELTFLPQAYNNFN
jgi:hypothetical protein